MFRFPKFWLTCAVLCMAFTATAQTSKYPGVGRNATAKEVAKWDIDVRPDFKGLPVGSGSVAKGQEVWEAKCAQCHGVFGESNEVFSPLIGGTSAVDIRTGRVANLSRTDYPGRTTIMKVPTVSTLWDYINRAMPWTAPKSLSADEVYAVTAFMLNLANVLPDDFVLSDKNIQEAQARMPNRNGMTTQHGLWMGKEFAGLAKADTSNVICMKQCRPEPQLASLLPAFARNAHGNLKEQNRAVGQQLGADTTQPEKPLKGSKTSLTDASVVGAVPVKPDKTEHQSVFALLNKYSCMACHAMDKKIVGPGFNEVAQRQGGKTDYLLGKIKSGSMGVYDNIPMPPQTLPETDAQKIAEWISKGAPK
jgi:cytochrome c